VSPLPPIEGWGEVPSGCKLGDCLHVFPQDNCWASQLNITRATALIEQDASNEFFGWDTEIESCFFKGQIRLHNPERKCGTLEGRLSHLTRATNSKSQQLDPEKCVWLPSVPETVRSAAAVFEDRTEGRLFFAKKYRCGTIHLVFVSPIGRFEAGRVSGLLVTQFPFAVGGRQETARLRWKRKK
jgi:hypothetical protein